ncbi:MAG: FAD:protein FMN transferase [Acidimicrobiales bacterium]
MNGSDLAPAFAALGTTAVVRTVDPTRADAARAVVEAEIAEIDRACSRFRPDAELLALNAAVGRPMAVSPTLFTAVEEALRAARITDGRVDPTIGSRLSELGYDRDFASVPPDGPPLVIQVRRMGDWARVTLDPVARSVELPVGVALDLGATAKALCADRAALAAAAATGTGVLVSLGGDISVAGEPPDGGWVVRVCDDHAAPDVGPFEDVAITGGGLATSSTTVRHWSRGADDLHHVLDPWTGRPAPVVWRTATVAASSCLDANIATTAALILGAAATTWLVDQGLPARLVRADGTVVVVGGWPEP